MTPAARIAAAIEILDAFAASDREMADKILTRWARAHRFAGSKDRAAIADRVYDALRRWRSYGARFGDTGRGRALGSLAAEGRSIDEIAALFDGGRFAPSPLAREERGALARGASETSGSAEDPLDWPEWLVPELDRSTADARAEIRASSRRAAIDLRVNAAKADRETARRRLIAEAAEIGRALAATPGPFSPTALRLDRPAALQRLPLFEDGWIEPQDAASQAAALIAIAEAPAGATVLDYCAGGGGKTLAMAAAAPEVALFAYDVAPQRMADLPPRAARAGASVALLERADLARMVDAADIVLVDAPCSGSGAWARNPDAKWRLTPARLDALRAAQRDALAAASAYVRPGGRLVYATCSLLALENAEATAAFLARASDFAVADPEPLWRAAGLVGEPPLAGDALSFSPATTATDGFFVAVLVRGR